MGDKYRRCPAGHLYCDGRKETCRTGPAGKNPFLLDTGDSGKHRSALASADDTSIPVPPRIYESQYAKYNSLTAEPQPVPSAYGQTPKKPQPKIDDEPENPAGTPRCPACGQFVPHGQPHSCTKKKLLTVAPGLQLAGTAGVAAAAFALGPVAVVALAAVSVASFVLSAYLVRKARERLVQAAYEKPRTPEVAVAQQDADEFLKKMNVDGQVRVVVNEGEKQYMPNASALWSPDGNHVIIVNRPLLTLPEEQVRAILAHEVAHLQKNNSAKRYVRSAALPTGLAAGVGSGAAVGLGAAATGGIVAVVWFAAVAGSAAISRREERRADREAYKAVGDHYPKALEAVHSHGANTVRNDLPWRTEDLLATHGNLPNRIADLKN